MAKRDYGIMFPHARREMQYSDDYAEYGGVMNQGYSERTYDYDRGFFSQQPGYGDYAGAGYQVGPYSGYRRRAAPRETWTEPGPHTGKGPRSYQRSDERIREQIVERLTRHGRLDASDIDVTVDHGEATLTGFVRSRTERRMAEDTADSVAGVLDVNNRLSVGASEAARQHTNYP